MKHAAFAIILLSSLAILPLSALDTGVGTISSLSGDVRIDAFGKNAFIVAIKGDLLYPATVLRTGANGTAELVVGGKKSSLGPSATVRVADLVALAKKGTAAWLSSFVDLFKNVKDAAGGQSDVMLGTRAAELPSSAAEWVVEDDAGTILKEAQVSLDAGAYRETLRTLAAFPASAEAAQAQARDYMDARCHLALEEYVDAERYFALVLARSAEPRVGFADEEMRVRTLFGLGVARFMIGREGEAIGPLKDLLSRELSPSVDPYARLFLVKSLWLAGDAEGAQERLAAARRKYGGTAFEAIFAPAPDKL